MTDADMQTGRQLLQEDFIKCNPKCAAGAYCEWQLRACSVCCTDTRGARLRWVKELELMLETREKAEIRARPCAAWRNALFHMLRRRDIGSAQRR